MSPSAENPMSGEAAGRAEEGRQVHVFRRLGGAFVSTDSYGLVLLLILATYVLAASLRANWVPSALLFVQIVTVWFALRTSRARRSVRLAANVVLVAAAVIGIVGAIGGDTSAHATVFVASSVLYVIAPVSIVRNLILRRVVDQETMLGAVAAYLLMGMSFAFIYQAIGATQAGAFFGPNGEGTISQDLFFSFTTLTTTGYGNLVPAGNPGQSLAVLEMIIGQLFLITAVGKIVTVWRPRIGSPPGGEDA